MVCNIFVLFGRYFIRESTSGKRIEDKLPFFEMDFRMRNTSRVRISSPGFRGRISNEDFDLRTDYM